MALSSVVKTQFDAGTLVVKDGTGTPLSVTMRFDNADLTISGIQQALKETKAYQSRGKFVSLRKGPRAPLTGSFSLMLTDLSEASSGTFLDMVIGKGAFSSRVTTGRIGGDVVTFDMVWTVEGTTYGDGSDQTVELQDVEFVIDLNEGDPNTIKASFTCYGDLKVNGSTFIDVN